MQKFLQQLTAFLISFKLLLAPVIFILIAGVMFAGLSQGQDVLLIAAESERWPSLLIIAVSFFAFVCWYTSRMLVNIKNIKNAEELKDDKKPPVFWSNVFPRVLAYAAFFAVQAAIIYHPYFNTDNDGWWVAGLLALQVVIFIIIHQTFKNKGLGNASLWIFPITLGVVFVASWLLFGEDIHRHLVVLLVGLWIVQVAFLIWNIIRRNTPKYAASDNEEWQFRIGRWVLAKMPIGEKNYFLIFIGFAAIALVVYIAAIAGIGAARVVGPFNIVMVSFSVLLCFFQFVSMASIWNKINFHFLIFIVMIIVSFIYSPYDLRMEEVESPAYDNRKTLEQYAKAWLEARKADITDSARYNDSNKYPIYFVLSDGGASRSGYWVAGALGRLETETNHKFSRHLFVLSGASGGSVGNAVFYALLDSAARNAAFKSTNYSKAGRAFLENDFLSFTLSHMVGPDYFRHILPLWLTQDRAAALEESMENPEDDNFMGPMFSRKYSEYVISFNQNTASLPLFYINTTRVKDGMPGVVSNIKLDGVSTRIDVLTLIDTSGTACGETKYGDINYSSAACLSARFPYISPAADVYNKNYFVDGGYFDNSGAGIAMETIVALQQIIDTQYPGLKNKVVFKIIHMSNSDGTPTQPGRMNPIVNDLFTPLLTLGGTFSNQTNVNNDRLKKFVAVYANQNCTDCWTRVNLYDALDSIPDKYSFSMNWVISDTTRKRMDTLIYYNPNLRKLIETVNAER